MRKVIIAFCLACSMSCSVSASDTCCKIVTGAAAVCNLVDGVEDFCVDGVCRSDRLRDTSVGKEVRKCSFLGDALVSNTPNCCRKSVCCKELGKFAIRTARVLTAVEFYYLMFYRDEGKLSFMEAICAYPTTGFGM